MRSGLWAHDLGGWANNAVGRTEAPGWNPILHNGLKWDNIFMKRPIQGVGYPTISLGDFGRSLTRTTYNRIHEKFLQGAVLRELEEELRGAGPFKSLKQLEHNRILTMMQDIVTVNCSPAKAGALTALINQLRPNYALPHGLSDVRDMAVDVDTAFGTETRRMYLWMASFNLCEGRRRLSKIGISSNVRPSSRRHPYDPASGSEAFYKSTQP